MYKKHIIIISCILLIIVLLFGCISTNTTENREAETEGTVIQDELYTDYEEKAIKNEEPVINEKKVGVAMPTRSSERWINDGMNMKARLEAIGYEVDLQYADDNIELQVEQIYNMILNGADCLVIASVDSAALVGVLEKAKHNGVYVIAYDRLLMETDAVSYYATFDNKAVGTLIGKYIEDEKSLKSAFREKRSYTIEFFMGSPDDNNAVYLYRGLMEVLQPYLDNGTLICNSGKISFEETCILRWSRETAEQRCTEYLDTYYNDVKLDIACSAFDGFAYGVKTALLNEGYVPGKDWPIITGQDAELNAIKDIIGGTQTMSIYKDTRVLATKCVTMVKAVLEGGIPEINDTRQYNNGKMIVPSYLCTSIAIDKENYKQIIVDSGYYTEVQLMD